MRWTFACSRKVIPRTRRANPEGHVRVLGVGNNESARRWIRFYLGQLGVEGLHAWSLSACPRVIWTAVAERSGDTALAASCDGSKCVIEARFERGIESGVAASLCHPSPFRQ